MFEIFRVDCIGKLVNTALRDDSTEVKLSLLDFDQILINFCIYDGFLEFKLALPFRSEIGLDFLNLN